MKILNLVFCFLFTCLMLAQNSENTSTEKPKFYFTYGINAQIHDELNIDKKLKNVGLPTVKSFTPELFLGMTLFGKKYSADLDFGFLNSKNESGQNENKRSGFTTRLRVHYNIITEKKYAFTAGLNVSNTISDVVVFSKNAIIDLNNLTPSVATGTIALKNNSYYFGPSASLYLFNDKKTKVRLNMGYEFAFTNGKWKSDYADVNNTVNENGNNRLVFGISIL